MEVRVQDLRRILQAVAESIGKVGDAAQTLRVVPEHVDGKSRIVLRIYHLRDWVKDIDNLFNGEDPHRVLVEGIAQPALAWVGQSCQPEWVFLPGETLLMSSGSKKWLVKVGDLRRILQAVAASIGEAGNTTGSLQATAEDTEAKSHIAVRIYQLRDWVSNVDKLFSDADSKKVIIAGDDPPQPIWVGQAC